jgi:hypothetical protein
VFRCAFAEDILRVCCVPRWADPKKIESYDKFLIAALSGKYRIRLGQDAYSLCRFESEAWQVSAARVGSDDFI